MAKSQHFKLSVLSLLLTLTQTLSASSAANDDGAAAPVFLTGGVKCTVQVSKAEKRDESNAAVESLRLAAKDETNEGAALRLTGEIKHTDHLEPLDSRLRPGKRYCEELLPKRDRSNGIWYRIANWMAGRTWQSEKSTRYYYEDLKTHRVKTRSCSFTDRGEQTLGWQRDCHGDIWQYNDCPFSSESEGEDTFTVHINLEIEPLELCRNKFVSRWLSVQIQVDKESRRIKDVIQVESINTFTPVADGVIKIDQSSKNFDAQGQELYLQKAYSINRRTEDFDLVDHFHGRDMRGSFLQYLTSQNLSELMPDQN